MRDVLADFADIIIPTTKSSAGLRQLDLGLYSNDSRLLPCRNATTFASGLKVEQNVYQDSIKASCHLPLRT
jgi:hypothetical protein